VAEQPLRAGGRIGPQPVAYVCCQPDPAVVPGRQRQARQRPPQPREADFPAVQRVIHRSVAATATPAPATAPPPCAPGPACTAPRRPARTAHPGFAQALVQLPPECRQPALRLIIPAILTRHVIDITIARAIRNHTATASITKFLRNEPGNDDAVAVCYHGGTPDNSGRTCQTGQESDYKLTLRAPRPQVGCARGKSACLPSR